MTAARPRPCASNTDRREDILATCAELAADKVVERPELQPAHWALANTAGSGAG